MNVQRGPTLGCPAAVLVALFAAAMLVEDPHCFASLANCLLYDSSSVDLIESGKRRFHQRPPSSYLFRQETGLDMISV